MTISADEVLKALHQEFPLHYELCVQRVINAKQGRRIAELERAQAAAEPSAATAEE
jgi:hypothetical protein